MLRCSYIWALALASSVCEGRPDPNWKVIPTVAKLPPVAAAAPAKEGAVPSTGPSDKRLAPFDKMMTDFLKAHPDIPGATLAVARDGKLVYSRGFGHAEGKQPM